MKSPCTRGCPDRRAGTKDAPSCHSSCEAYQQFREPPQLTMTEVDE